MSAELAGKRVAILAEELYEDPELWYPYYRLLEAGAEVKIVGSGRAETFKSKHGYPVTPDLSIDKPLPENFDAVIIPGGYSPDHMRRKPAMVDFVREMDRAGKPVAAICHAGWMLVSAGIVKGRRATGFFSIKDDLVAAGARYVDEPVVVDGNLITSRSPKDLPFFLPAIIEALARARAAV
ncbi:MAG: protease [Actinobacteria bacterium 13_2_20CM_2_66_6]|nr:MAG: protease [Actinobacteria bacterium 13_2_20CM_2_66_6]